jgi:crossover junction endodeoxyribonuclease RuvC
MKNLILGIDPGSLKTGFGLIEFDLKTETLKHLNHGVIVLGDQVDLPPRLLALSESLQMLLKKYQPDHVVIEQIFLGRNPDSAFKLGHARGVALSEAMRAGARLFEYSTRFVKKAVSGTGAAKKEEVLLCLQRILNLQKIVNLDASDALALAVCHSQQLMAQATQNKMESK